MLVKARRDRIESVLSNRTRNLRVVLDRLEDPFNMAAVLRTCEAFGVQEIHVIRDDKAGFRPNSKVTQGCEKWLDITLHESFAGCAKVLHASGLKVIATAATKGAVTLGEIPFEYPTALVFGNERTGVGTDSLRACDGTLWIPMFGFSQSLNISAAASACLSIAVARRLATLGHHGDLEKNQEQELRDRFTHLSIKQRRRIASALDPFPTG